MTEINTQVPNKVSSTSELVEDTSFKPALPQKPSKKASKPLLKLVKIALLVGVGYGVYRFFIYQPEPDGLFLSGRIESYETNVSAKIGGRIAQIDVEEGSLVKFGQILVKIDDSDTQAQLQGAIAQVKAKEQQLQRLHQQLPVIAAQLQQANLLTQQTKEESKGKVIEVENNLAVAQSQLAEAQANLKLALIKQQRIHSLFAEGAVAAQQQDEIDSQVEVYQANVAMVQQQVKAAQGVLTQARSSLHNEPIRAAAELEIKRKLTQARTDIAIAEQDINNAQANQAHIQANLNYLLIKSPMVGNVITKIAEPGEVVAAGAPLLTLVNLDRLYLRGFIPEEQIGQIKLGLKALVYLDSFPKQPLEATVTRIDPKASFTPKNIYFKKDRVTQVFGIELTLKNPQGKAKPGMPADGRILVQKTQQKQSSNHLPAMLRFLGL